MKPKPEAIEKICPKCDRDIEFDEMIVYVEYRPFGMSLREYDEQSFDFYHKSCFDKAMSMSNKKIIK